LVRAQTTSYQNFWQEMGNVQTLTEAEQEWLHLQFLSIFLPHPAGQITDVHIITIQVTMNTDNLEYSEKQID
jgi:hypothetical protein